MSWDEAGWKLLPPTKDPKASFASRSATLAPWKVLGRNSSGQWLRIFVDSTGDKHVQIIFENNYKSWRLRSVFLLNCGKPKQPLFWSLPSFLALASTLQPSLRSRLRLAFQPGTRNPSADGHQLQDMDGSSSSQWLAQESAYLVLNAIDIDYGNLERNQTQRMQKILGALDGFPCGIRCITLL